MSRPRRAPLTEAIELRFFDRSPVVVQARVIEAGIFCIDQPLADVGGQWLPLQAGPTRWVVVPTFLEVGLEGGSFEA